jgi:hypothetical protein
VGPAIGLETRAITFTPRAFRTCAVRACHSRRAERLLGSLVADPVPFHQAIEREAIREVEDARRLADAAPPTAARASRTSSAESPLAGSHSILLRNRRG